MSNAPSTNIVADGADSQGSGAVLSFNTQVSADGGGINTVNLTKSTIEGATGGGFRVLPYGGVTGTGAQFTVYGNSNPPTGQVTSVYANGGTGYRVGDRFAISTDNLSLGGYLTPAVFEVTSVSAGFW